MCSVARQASSSLKLSCGVAVSASPAMASRHRTPPSCCSAVSLHIGRHRIHAGMATAIDDDGNLRAEPGFEPGRLNGRPDAAGQRRRVGDFLWVEPCQRPCFHRHAGSHRNAKRIDVGCQKRCGFRRQAADLQASARGYFHHAVAVTERGFAESDQGLGRKTSSNRVEADQEPVARLHRRGQRGAGATARIGVHAATCSARASAIRAASSSSTLFLSGCHRPRRRAVAKRSAMNFAAAGFSRSMKARTFASPR